MLSADRLSGFLMSSNVSSIARFASAVLIFLVAAKLFQKLEPLFIVANFKSQHGCKDPPAYPHKDPIWGSDFTKLRKQAAKNGTLVQFLDEQYIKHGKTWSVIENGETVIYTTSHINAQHIWAIQQPQFEKVIDDQETLRLVGHGILISNGAQWRRSRDLVRPTFARYEVDNMPLVKGHVDRFIDALPRDASTFDIQERVKQMFLDISIASLFGESFDAQLDEKRGKGKAFLLAFDDCFGSMLARRNASWSERLRMALFEDKAYTKNLTKVHGYLDERIQRAFERTSQKTTATGMDDLDFSAAEEGFQGRRYILLDELAKQISDPIQIRGEILQVFAGARDNTAILVSNALFELARHPEHWSSLRRTALDLGPEPTYDFGTLKSLTPFQHFLFETLRVHGPGFMTRRKAITDIVLPQGGGPDGKSPLFVPKGKSVYLHRQNMHRNRDFWGGDACEFKPERWQGLKTTWEFVPFSGGPRVCPAINQAYVQATYVLVRLVREFQAIENRDDVLEYVEVMKTVMQSRRGVQIALVPTTSST